MLSNALVVEETQLDIEIGEAGIIVDSADNLYRRVTDSPDEAIPRFVNLDTPENAAVARRMWAEYSSSSNVVILKLTMLCVTLSASWEVSHSYNACGVFFYSM